MLNKLKNRFIKWFLKDLFDLQKQQLGYLIGNSIKSSNIQVSLNMERKEGIEDKLKDAERLEEYLFKNLPEPEDKEKWM